MALFAILITAFGPISLSTEKNPGLKAWPGPTHTERKKGRKDALHIHVKLRSLLNFLPLISIRYNGFFVNVPYYLT
jgi:hypothetical protein